MAFDHQRLHGADALGFAHRLSRVVEALRNLDAVAPQALDDLIEPVAQVHQLRREPAPARHLDEAVDRRRSARLLGRETRLEPQDRIDGVAVAGASRFVNSCFATRTKATENCFLIGRVCSRSATATTRTRFSRTSFASSFRRLSRANLPKPSPSVSCSLYGF